MPAEVNGNGNGKIPVWAYRVGTAILGIILAFLIKDYVTTQQALVRQLAVFGGTIEGVRHDIDKLEGQRLRDIDERLRELERGK